MTPERTWITIDSTAYRHNMANISRIIGKRVKISPVIKANAYGHGTAETVTALRKTDFWAYSVASGDEALALAELTKKPILVLSSWLERELPDLLRRRVQLVVWDTQAIATVARVAKRLGHRAQVHLKIDTGTSRIGVRPNLVPEVLERIRQHSSLRLAGVFTHFADTEARATALTYTQLDRFTRATDDVPPIVMRHAACTAAAFLYQETRLDLVRLGIGLYGVWPSPETKRVLQSRLTLRPVLSWYSVLQQLKTIPAGSYVGYGATKRVSRRTVIGIVPVGYYDGIDRSLSNRGRVIIRGNYAPILGRVCMNMIMVDCTSIKNAKVGETVTVIGQEGSTAVTADDHATWADSIPHETLARILPTIPRHLL